MLCHQMINYKSLMTYQRDRWPLKILINIYSINMYILYILHFFDNFDMRRHSFSIKNKITLKEIDGVTNDHQDCSNDVRLDIGNVIAKLLDC